MESDSVDLRLEVSVTSPSFATDSPSTASFLSDEVCALYESERTVLLRYLRSLRADTHDAQEIIQETFLAYYLARKKGEVIDSHRAWLFAVASRQFFATKRSARGREVALTEDTFALVESAENPTTRLLSSERAEILAEAIRALSPQQQVCLHLRTEGLCYREIANALGVSVPTVSEFLRRAISRLRKVVHDSVV